MHSFFSPRSLSLYLFTFLLTSLIFPSHILSLCFFPCLYSNLIIDFACLPLSLFGIHSVLSYILSPVRSFNSTFFIFLPNSFLFH